MHIELTEMLRCPADHAPAYLVLSTGEMLGRSVRSGVLGCPVCRTEFPIVEGVVDFGGAGSGERDLPARREAGDAPSGLAPRSPLPPADPQALQALLDLGGPGGIVALVGAAARHAVGLAGLLGGIHFVGVNAPPDLEELPVLSLLVAPGFLPLRDAVVRGVVLGADVVDRPWLAEGVRVLLPGRRLVVEAADPEPPGARRLAASEGLWVGEKV